MTNVVAVNGADIIGKLALIIGVAYLGYIVHVVVVTACPSSSSQDEPHRILQGPRPGYDHRVYHHVLQRDAARQH